MRAPPVRVISFLRPPSLPPSSFHPLSFLYSCGAAPSRPSNSNTTTTNNNNINTHARACKHRPASRTVGALLAAAPRHGTQGLNAFQLQAPDPNRGCTGITVHDTKGQQFFTEEEERCERPPCVFSTFCTCTHPPPPVAAAANRLSACARRRRGAPSRRGTKKLGDRFSEAGFPWVGRGVCDWSPCPASVIHDTRVKVEKVCQVRENDL